MVRPAPPRWAPLLPALTLACSDDGDSRGSSSATAALTLPGLTLTTGSPATGSSGDDTGLGTGTGDSGQPATSTTTTTGGVKFDVGDGSGGATTGPVDSMCPCAPKLDLIYVLSDDRELWTYDPESNSFALIGPLGCPTTDGTFSMGVGRDGYAWIQTTAPKDILGQNYIGDLYRLDVTAPQNCTDPGYTPGAGGWTHFGMAFVSASESDPCDRLYGQHWNGEAGSWSEGPNQGLLGVFDAQNLVMQTIGATNYNGAELTGTGDGRLYAFGGTPSAKLIQFDKQSAAELEKLPLDNLPLTSAFAFAFWGGDFYFFTLKDELATTSKVTKLDYDGSDGQGKVLTTVNADAPIRIVGAGVSTCAPINPPG